MKYNPQIHKRRSIRLKGYDYSQAGLYFVTICVQHRACLFGKIENGKMILNDAGKMIEKWYYELTNKFKDIKCDEMVVMPDHFHCIVENVGAVLDKPMDMGEPVCSPLCPPVCSPLCPPVCSPMCSPLVDTGEPRCSPLGVLGEHLGSPLGAVVQWFKTMTTNEYIRGVKNLGWKPFNGKLWQRNYYERIVRNKKAHQNISNYIRNNPAKWWEKRFNKYNKRS